MVLLLYRSAKASHGVPLVFCYRPGDGPHSNASSESMNSRCWGVSLANSPAFAFSAKLHLD